MSDHERFEWHEDKAEANAKKHRVTFDDAAFVLKDDEADLYHLEEYDDKHSKGEDRYLTIGSHPARRSIVLVICWTRRHDEEGRVVTRIISAAGGPQREEAIC